MTPVPHYKTRFLLFVLGGGVSAFLSGCAAFSAGGGAVTLPPHIKTLCVRPFANTTQFFGLEDALTQAIANEFIQDGRLAYVSNEPQANGVLIGEITGYLLQPVSYDASLIVQEYKLTVRLNVKFVDQATNTVVWEEPRLEQDFQFFVQTRPGGLSEADARLRIWDLFARDIVKRTIEGSGTAAGAAPRKAEETTPSEAPASPQEPPVISGPRPY
jgi:hypothetical protein